MSGGIYVSKMYQYVYLLLSLLKFISILEKDKIVKQEIVGVKGFVQLIQKTRDTAARRAVRIV